MDRGDGTALVINDGETALERKGVAIEDAVHSGDVRVRKVETGKFDGDGVGLGAGVGGGVVEELEGDAVGVVAHLGDGLGEPAVDGAIHQQVAERKHEDQWNKGDQNGSPQHARAQAGAEDAAALVGVKAQEVADEKDEDDDEEDERQCRERDEDQRLQRRGRVEETEVEGVERGEEDEKKHTDAEADEEAAAGVGCAHGASVLGVVSG